jgi:hypothetical protein
MNSAEAWSQEPRQAPTGGGEASVISAVRDDLRAPQAVVEGTARGTGQEFFRFLSKRT